MTTDVIVAALLPPLVLMVFVVIWRISALFILLLRATREDRQPIDFMSRSSREKAQELLEKARLECIEADRLKGLIDHE